MKTSKPTEAQPAQQTDDPEPAKVQVNPEPQVNPESFANDKPATEDGAGERQVVVSGPVDENVFIEDALAKYKENEREIKRERKFWIMEKEKEQRYKKRLDDWLYRETAKQKNQLREDER